MPRRAIVIRVIICGGLLVLLLFLAFRPGMGDRARIDTINFAAGMDSYWATYGTYPTGDNATILGALRGTNPRNLIFLHLDPRLINATGAFIDPWQTPYEIKIHSTNSVSIRSAGRNKRFGDADDVTNAP